MIEYYTVYNTGWTNGKDWFPVMQGRHDSRRFKTHEEAQEYIYVAHWGDSKVNWRIGHHIVTRVIENDRIIEQNHTIRYAYVDAEIKPERLD
jgi:hypothetical protein